VADWHWEPVTYGLLDELPPAALAAVRQVAEELTVRESMIFLDGREFTGVPPGLRTVQRGPLTRTSAPLLRPPCAWTGSCCYLGFYQCEVALPGAISVADLAWMTIITCERTWRT
jgi:hypothetical protein